MDSEVCDISDNPGDLRSRGSVPTTKPASVSSNRRFVIFSAALIVVGLLAIILSAWNISRATANREANLANLERVTEELAILYCEGRNEARINDKAQFEYLLELFIGNEPSYLEDTARFRTFLEDANDPLNCDYTSPDFGKDTTPPRPLPSTPTVTPSSIAN